MRTLVFLKQESEGGGSRGGNGGRVQNCARGRSRDY